MKILNGSNDMNRFVSSIHSNAEANLIMNDYQEYWKESYYATSYVGTSICRYEGVIRIQDNILGER